jgi:lipid-A-disaccharide synthase
LSYQPEDVPLLVVAGEASGDQHAARLLTALRRERPDVAAFGMGGEELLAAGLERLADSQEVAVVGIAEALKVLPRARQVFHQLLAESERRRPPLAVLVDFPEFNLRLARQLAKRGIRVAYYVSPQVWAWRRRRVRTIARFVDRMLVLLPFEAAFYRDHGVEVEHVGHPLVDEVPQLPQAWDRPRAADDPFRVVLLPGSRRSEIAAVLPPMLAGAASLAGQTPIALTLVRAQTVPREQIEALLAGSPLPVRVVESGDRYAAIAGSHLALCASGTATLEVGMLGTPLVVLYRLHPWSYWLGRALVRLPWFSLVNLVLGEAVVPELLQRETRPERVAAEGLRLLRDAAARDAMRHRLAELRPRLGESGASGRAAQAVARLLPAPGGGAVAGSLDRRPREACG